MTRKSYSPSPPAHVEVLREAGRATLLFVRDLAHAPDRVWRALTDPTELREWSPFDADRDLGTPGAATLTMAGGDGSETHPCRVRRAEPPSLLEYTWGEDVLRWELEVMPFGTRLTLRHTTQDPTWIPRVSAGWHICLDVAEAYMSGNPIGRIVGEEAKQYGWERLNAEYSSKLAK